MTIHKPGNTALSLLDFETLFLKEGEEKEQIFPLFEVVLVIIEGSCIIGVGKETWNLGRKNVFEDKASAVFISPGTMFTLSAKTQTVLALCKARAQKRFKTVFVPQGQVKEEWRGASGYRRRVYNIINTETETERIAVGETINEPGEWSSFPPHKHDKREENNGSLIETPLEEIYYFKINPKTGFGFQRLYTKDGLFDESYIIKDGDTTHISRGYHPVANIPGHHLYYLWMLAGEERRYIWNVDPEFRWLEKND